MTRLATPPVTLATPAPTPGARLVVEDLRVAFGGKEVVRGVSFGLAAGQCLAIVGESGSGKSVTARSLVGLAGRDARVGARSLTLGPEHEGGAAIDLRSLPERAWRDIRGRRIGVVLQDALVSLDPVRPVGKEIAEAVRLHGGGNRAERAARVLEVLDLAGVPQPEVRARQRPDQLSGGLRQRALIASAIAARPGILIADEPTTALDVTVQAQVLEVFEQMKAAGESIVLISHDLGVVSHLADEILVMNGGEVVEQGRASEVLGNPRHEYTRRLLQSVPSAATRGRSLASGARIHHRPAPGGEVVISARGLRKTFDTPGGGRTTAVDDVSFDLRRGETLGIVGESGSGKSTTMRLVLGLEKADAGDVRLLGEEWSALREPERRSRRRAVSVVQQDPLSSFDPRWDVADILLDALPADGHSRAARRAEAASLLDHVRLPAAVLGRTPLTLSGGQRQRVSIARALAPRPDVLVLDEAVSALDVSVQAQILDLLAELRASFGTSTLFVSHDLGVIAHASDRVIVMKDGRIVEEGTPDRVFTEPEQPYTRTLIDALAALGRGAKENAA